MNWGYVIFAVYVFNAALNLEELDFEYGDHVPPETFGCFLLASLCWPLISLTMVVRKIRRAFA